MATLIHVTKVNVNDPELEKELTTFICDIVTNDSFAWRQEHQVDVFRGLLKDLMQEFEHEYNILDQGYVKLDLNPSTSPRFIVHMQFRQKNCLNTTKLTYFFD